MSTATMVSVIMHEIQNLGQKQKGILAASLSCGTILGCVLSGYVSDKYGRVFAFKRQILVSLVGLLSLFWAQSYTGMICSIMVVGLGNGGDFALTNTIAFECFPPTKRSKITLMSVAWSLGSAVSYGGALVLSYFALEFIELWRLVVLVTFFYTVYVAFLRQDLVETPMFLHQKGLTTVLDQTLTYIYKFNGSSEVDHYFPMMNDWDEANIVEENVSDKAGVLSLFDQHNRVTTLALTVLFFLSGYGYSGLLFFMPSFLPTDNNIEAYTVILIQQISGVPGKLLAAYCVDTKLGRKWTTAVGFLATSFFLVPFLVTTNFALILLSTSLYYSFVNMGYSGLYTITAEAFETRTRTLGNGWLLVFSRVSNIVGPVLVAFLFELGGVFLSMLVTITGYFSLFFVCFFLKETRTPHKLHQH